MLPLSTHHVIGATLRSLFSHLNVYIDKAHIPDKISITLHTVVDLMVAVNVVYKEPDTCAWVIPTDFRLRLQAQPTGLFGALRERGVGGSRCGSTAATAAILRRPG